MSINASEKFRELAEGRSSNEHMIRVWSRNPSSILLQSCNVIGILEANTEDLKDEIHRLLVINDRLIKEPITSDRALIQMSQAQEILRLKNLNTDKHIFIEELQAKLRS